jgi:hypothetical protein
VTNEEAFRLGFLAHCAEVGLSPEQVAEKSAFAKQASFGSAVGWGLGAAGAGLALAPPALGYLGGYTLARADADDINPEDVKKQELIAEYRRLAARARQARLQRRVQASGGRSLV